MKHVLLDYVRCPLDRGDLDLVNESLEQGEIAAGSLRCRDCGKTYPIIDFIPRFVPTNNYADSFLFQRQHHARLQMDKYSGTTIQADTIRARTGWDERFVAGKTLLECGCGAGPDTQVLLDWGASVTSVDLSGGVDFCRDNNYPNERLNILQASIMNLPLRAESYDIVYCHRVIQHTPNPAATFREIVSYLKPGGTLFLHSYARSPRHLLQWKYWLRPLTIRVNHRLLHRIISIYAPALHPVVGLLDRNRWTRQINFHLLPYRNYQRIFPQLSRQQLIEYGIHDTFDALSPRYDFPSSVTTVESWLAEAGLVNPQFHSKSPICVTAQRPK